jgi:hypothetical protein
VHTFLYARRARGCILLVLCGHRENWACRLGRSSEPVYLLSDVTMRLVLFSAEHLMVLILPSMFLTTVYDDRLRACSVFCQVLPVAGWMRD